MSKFRHYIFLRVQALLRKGLAGPVPRRIVAADVDHAAAAGEAFCPGAADVGSRNWRWCRRSRPPPRSSRTCSPRRGLRSGPWRSRPTIVVPHEGRLAEGGAHLVVGGQELMRHARLVPSAIQFSAYQLRRGATAKDAIADEGDASFQLWYGDELADGKREEWRRVGSGRGRPQRDPPFLGHAKERELRVPAGLPASPLLGLSSGAHRSERIPVARQFQRLVHALIAGRLILAEANRPYINPNLPRCVHLQRCPWLHLALAHPTPPSAALSTLSFHFPSIGPSPGRRLES
ncbi:hypothetical protein GW17_00014914, partial [Ensete ventricosum]